MGTSSETSHTESDSHAAADGAASPSATNRRTRVTKACDQCRHARRKCDANLPRCHSCIVLRQTCSHTQKQKKRGMPTGYIWALEVTLVLLLDEDPANGEVVRRFLASGPAARRRRLSVYNNELMKRFHATWHNSEIRNDINEMLEGEDPPGANFKHRRRGTEDSAEPLVESGAQDGLDVADGASQWPLL